jgi:hypothetical protein
MLELEGSIHLKRREGVLCLLNRFCKHINADYITGQWIPCAPSKTGQAADRSLKNIPVGIIQQFHNTRNSWLDLLLQFGWGVGSEAQMAPSGQGNTHFVLQEWTGS